MSRDLDAVTSPEPAWLVSLEPNPVDVPIAKFGDLRSYRDGDINSDIKSYVDTFGKAERTAILRDFQNQEYRFPIPKSLIRQTEKQEKEDKEHWQLQSFSRFTQTQQSVLLKAV